MYGIFNRGLRWLLACDCLLDEPVVHCYLGAPAALTATLGWGRSRHARRARRVAQRRGIPFLCLEDGFLRSLGLGRDELPLSLVVDDLGIYYDAGAPSRLELMVARPLHDSERIRAQSLVLAWRQARVSKYNHLREVGPDWAEEGCRGNVPYVLVVDQTLGDASIRYGMGGARAFTRMLEAALAENPGHLIVLKVHPEVMAGYKRGHFDLTAVRAYPRVRVVGRDAHPVSLIEHAQALYVVTSQMGFEGILWGKRVRTFGMPFYAGWGLTDDELSPPDRRQPVAFENLVHAALVDYPRYIDPETRERCEVERLLEWMGLQRRMRERFPADVVAVGFSSWKKPIVRTFLQGSTVVFVDTARSAPATAAIAVWGRRGVAPDSPAAGQGLRVSIEDGFLRSVGLGAHLVRPLSWVMDRRGIYYDATCPSDLEILLQTGRFDAQVLARARALRQRLVTTGVTKYNVGTARRSCPAAKASTAVVPVSVADAKLRGIPAAGPDLPITGRPQVILVPGQVESDASLAYGAPGISQNLDLLRAVRAAAPAAYLVYKPHPDVVAGLRRGGKREHEASKWCDEVVVDAAMGELLTEVDEVHTLTSLAGFEALLRGKKVVCYGQPFYAGWGLTADILPPDRRSRRLSLDELVAGVLIIYPTYVSRTTGRFTTPERALDELLVWRQEKRSLAAIYQRLFGLILRKD